MVAKPAVEWVGWRDQAVAEYLVASKDAAKVDYSGYNTVVVMAALLELSVVASKVMKSDIL